MIKINRCNETYYKFSDGTELIEYLTTESKIVFSIELFTINGNIITPYENLLSIDSTTLYNEDFSRLKNIRTCNEWIKNIIEKVNLEKADLYFSVIYE